MPRFFTEHISGDTALITGEDARHIGRSLRMNPGEDIILCDLKGTDYHCKIMEVSKDSVACNILSTSPSAGEPGCRITLYQALPKSDKLDYIVQKSVELGVSRVVPVLSRRCISRPDAKSMSAKQKRLQRIALEAAKQSGRGIIPEFAPLLDFPTAVEEVSEAELSLLFYEGGGDALRDLVNPQQQSISILVGSEGGFDPDEVKLAQSKGIHIATLGSRILRCETAPLCALSVLMYCTGNL